MQIAFVHQYTVRLVRNGRDTCFKYDFYDPKRRLLIETHGQQHYEAGAFERFSGQSLEQIQENDAEKARYASETLHMSYVELDCRRSDPSWIRREITAKLSCYPLEKIDWTAVRQNASKSGSARNHRPCQTGGYTAKNQRNRTSSRQYGLPEIAAGPM